MKQVIITFTRHEISRTQLEAAVAQGARDMGLEPVGFKDVTIINLQDEAKRDLLTDQSVRETGNLIRSWTLKNINPPFGDRKDSVVLGVFGVFPPMLLEYLSENHCCKFVNFYSAWNIQRTPEGGKPTFEFKRWCKLPLK